jgi:hypothetical protein
VENTSGGREYTHEKKQRIPLQEEKLYASVNAMWKVGEGL